ncbi:hypothetical protein F383_24734 [Gossypium arboreum]|uniref:Uncharacterized protein n=1 Tax=Gossypium arboreum TaxID=29729 RepID=A0A0B0MK67_GOSAR|nr:hypothetical protein F383_24734 [Gossypium arboreum]
MRFPGHPLVFQMVQRTVRGCVREMMRYDHVERVQASTYRQASLSIKVRQRHVQTSIGLLGIVNLNILSMACIGT